MVKMAFRTSVSQYTTSDVVKICCTSNICEYSWNVIIICVCQHAQEYQNPLPHFKHFRWYSCTVWEASLLYLHSVIIAVTLTIASLGRYILTIFIGISEATVILCWKLIKKEANLQDICYCSAVLLLWAIFLHSHAHVPATWPVSLRWLTMGESIGYHSDLFVFQ